MDVPRILQLVWGDMRSRLISRADMPRAVDLSLLRMNFSLD